MAGRRDRFLCASSCWHVENKTPNACLACPGHEVVVILSVSIYNIVFIISFASFSECEPFRLLIETKIPCIVFRFRENESCNENENATQTFFRSRNHHSFFMPIMNLLCATDTAIGIISLPLMSVIYFDSVASLA